MDINELKARLKDGKLGGCYILAGEEDYLKKYYLTKIREAIVTDEAFATFNHTVYDGAEVNFAAIRDDITSPPMMADLKLIEWRYPNFEKMKESDLTLFEQTVALLDEYDYATLVFLVAEDGLTLGTAKRETKFEKRFGKTVGILNFATSTDAALISWLSKHFAAEGIKAGADVLNALLFRAGHSMSVLHEEVAKLSAYAHANGRAEITVADVNLVASSTPECDTYALTNAILARDKKLALVALDEMKSRRVDPLVILGMMARTYSELADVVLMLRDGLDTGDIQAKTGMNTYRLRHYINAAPKFTAERIINIVAELERVDTGAKFGGVMGYTAIDLFVTKCV